MPIVAVDKFLLQKSAAQMQDPVEHGMVVVASDTDDLPFVTRSIIVGVGGDVRVTYLGGEDVILPLPAGEKQGRFTKIWATGTTASNIRAEY